MTRVGCKEAGTEARGDCVGHGDGKRAVVVGSGPNGLSAAITLARAGVRVEVLEANERIGGGARTEEVTLPGFWHDTGSSVYPMGVSSPFFRELPLRDFGLRWIEPGAPLAHPLDDGTAVMLHHSVEATAAGLGEAGGAYRDLMEPMVKVWPELVKEILGPVVHLPKEVFSLARFGMHAMLPASVLGKMKFGYGPGGERARVLLAGLAGHSVMPTDAALSSAIGLVLAAGAHAYGAGVGGWPIVEGGAQRLTEALAGYLRSLGGEIRTGVRVRSLGELAGADAVMCDVTPRQLLQMGAGEMQSGNRRLMERFAYGPGIFKIDWALRGPIPWAAKECLGAATVHVGGSEEEIAASERACWEGRVEERPFLILVQPSLFDGTRAPAGQHTAWAYCHVPNGWEGDATERIERQVERFAPGFGECVLARKVWGTRALEAWNPNLVGGDVSGGAMTPLQMVMRPTPRLWETSVDGVFLCSSSTPPGGGVHGMCGHLAGLKALTYLGM